MSSSSANFDTLEREESALKRGRVQVQDDAVDLTDRVRLLQRCRMPDDAVITDVLERKIRGQKFEYKLRLEATTTLVEDLRSCLSKVLYGVNLLVDEATTNEASLTETTSEAAKKDAELQSLLKVINTSQHQEKHLQEELVSTNEQLVAARSEATALQLQKEMIATELKRTTNECSQLQTLNSECQTKFNSEISLLETKLKMAVEVSENERNALKKQLQDCQSSFEAKNGALLDIMSQHEASKKTISSLQVSAIEQDLIIKELHKDATERDLLKTKVARELCLHHLP